MSDGQAHGYASKISFKDRAYETYGNLTEDELIEIGDNLNDKIQIKKIERDLIEKELDRMQLDYDKIFTVIVDFMNNCHRSKRKTK